MPTRVDLRPGQVWLGKSRRSVSRRIVCLEMYDRGDWAVFYSEGGTIRHCLRTSFLRWRGRRYDERHGQRGTLV